LPLDDTVRRCPTIDLRNDEQCESQDDESQYFVKEVAPRPNQSTIVQRLLYGVVDLIFGMMTLPQHRKTFV
jgi:hypothetical protein